MAHMIRRNVLLALTGLAAWPSIARAQQRVMPAIGFLSTGSPLTFAEFVAAFREGLREHGYVEGANVWIDYRWAEGHYDELKRLAAELVQDRVALIAATGGTIAAQTAIAATNSIPIVFVVGFDPAQLGLVASLNRPGGNATGVSIFTTQLATKRLEMLQNLVPPGITIGSLVNPLSSTTALETKDITIAAEQLGRPIITLNASSESELDQAFAVALDKKVGALVVSADPFFTTRRAQIIALAARHNIPAMYPLRAHVAAGGLMSYGPDLTWAYRRIGNYAARILSGANPADLPVEQPTEFKFVINLNTAKALGLIITPRFLALTDEAIE
jgi:putative ABC transport system substrate-binding protein